MYKPLYKRNIYLQILTIENNLILEYLCLNVFKYLQTIRYVYLMTHVDL